MQCWKAVIALLGILAAVRCRQYTLNVPRVLLPIVPASGVKANFTLKSQAGCFTWKSTKPDVASVRPLYANGETQAVHIGGDVQCSREALLTPQSSEQQSRLSTVIIAEEQTTGQTLRCDVFVDTIHRIEITTRTRELLLEEEPERFEILGFDEEGNTFSTLRGHKFDWMLLRDEEATHQTTEPEAILHFVRFDDSSYATDPIIGALEVNGYHGDTVLVEGVSTGTAKVSVRFSDRVWKDVVSAATVKLLVIENIMLQPAMDVYILPYCTVHYTVERKKQGKTEVVAMPSEQYSLELTNTTVASLDHSTSIVTGLVIGDTEIVLQDKNMLHTPSATKPTAGIHVVPPHHLGYSISPGNVWVLEVGREYEITVHVFDKFNHPILVTENVVMKTDLPTSHLHPLTSSHNESYHIVTAETVGKATIHASLNAVKRLPNGPLHKLTPVVSKDQSLEIYRPIRLKPDRLVILWDPATEFHYQYQMEATGGSGGYVWSCDPDTVAHVTSTGLVTSVAKGEALVTASDKKTSAHFDTAEVYVVSPSDMLFLPSRVEAAIGTTLSLPLQVRGAITMGNGERSLEPFSDCRRMSLSITSSESSVFNVTMDTETDPSSLPPKACLALSALAVLPGHTKLTVHYTHTDIHLEASVIIAAYPPLVPVDPSDIAILTLGTSYDVLFEGGPVPWVLDRSKYFQHLTAAVPSQLSLYERGEGSMGVGQHVWRVACRELGEQELKCEVGNRPTLKNAHPAREVATVRISCALPVSMTISPVVALSKECPLLQLSNQNAQFPVKAGQALELLVKVFDAENRPFSNFSSLEWTWGSSDQILLRPPSQGACLIHRRGSGDYLLVQLSQQSGSVVLTASSDSYKPDYLAEEKIDSQLTFSPGVNHSLSILLRHPPILTPSHFLLYNHHDNFININISNGSGHFVMETLTVSGQRVAMVNYSEQLHTVRVVPVGDGEVTIRIRDVCLVSADEIVAVVMVAGIHSLSVQVSDKVQVGSSIPASVRVLDRRGRPFMVDQHRLMQLQSNPKSHHIETNPVSLDTAQSHDLDQMSHDSVFNVVGRAVGHTHLVFNVTSPTGHVISSSPASVQVFDALKLSPKYIILLPTATFQIHSSGGPLLEAAVKFSIANAGVATVTEDTGLIEAMRPGKATVTGKAQAADPVSGHMTSYSQDEVYLTVLKLTGLRIAIATTRLLAGVELSVHAIGINDETPFAFASALPGLAFQWSSTNMDVVSLSSVYEKAGVSLQEEQDFAARLRTHNPGQAIVKLVATCHAGFCEPDKQVFRDEVKIEVIPPLTLVHPFSGKLLLPQGGHTKIITSRDGLSVLSYQLFHDGGATGEGEGVISVCEEGEVTAGGVNGHAVVMIMAAEEELGLNQSVIVHVEVATVVGLSLSPLSLAQATPNSKHHAFPLGYSAEFRVTLLDGSGRAFDYAEIPIGYRLNRFDIVRVTPSTNGTYIFKAASKGQVIIRVFVLPQSRIGDYIRVHVGYAIIPSLAVVHVGSKVCFTTHLTEESTGEWSTGDGGVMQLSPETGIGTAKSPGRAVIYHKIKGVSDTHTEITVKRVEEVVIKTNEKELPLFTNAQRQKELGVYSVLVSFYHTHSHREASLSTHDKGYFTSLTVSPNPACSSEAGLTGRGGGPLYIQQVPFQCLLELKENGRLLETEQFIFAEPHFDPKYGTSSCYLLPNNDHQGVEFLSTKDKLTLSLKVKVFDSASTYEVFSSPLTVPLLPAFSLSRDNITLTSTDPSTTITVTGLPHQLQAIQISAPHPLSVTKHTSSVNRFTYLLSLTERHPEPFSHFTITFTSSLTHQVATVTVSYSEETSVFRGAVAMETTTCLPQPTQQSHTSLEAAETPPIEATYHFIGENMALSVVVMVTFVAIVIGLMVICKALRDSSPKSSGGFTAYLPRSPSPQHAFSPTPSPQQNLSMTPGLQQTPPMPGSGSQSAFRRTGATRYSPSSSGLYSQ